MMNIKRYVFAALFALTLGCKSNTIEINTIKCYEGHYYSMKEAKAAVDKMQLDRGESVWILSNSTLKRVLKNK